MKKVFPLQKSELRKRTVGTTRVDVYGMIVL